jgi:hypothetical protein
MNGLTLAERVAAIDDALDGVPHAFGGALALAYYAEPRATIDIDVNVFVPPSRFATVLDPLAALGVDVAATAVEELIQRDGQVRVMWGNTPIDLFFAYDDFHAAAARACRPVPFADGTIPILSAEHLLVCKSIFDRPKDWVDIAAMLDAGTALDPAEVLRWVGRIAGDEDARYSRIVAVLTRPSA